MLSVSGLRVLRRDTALVDGVDLACATGERVAIVGASGSGKSLTARAILGALPPGLRAEGGIRVAGAEVREVPAARRATAHRPAAVLQDSALALHPLITVGDQMPRGADARELLDAVGLPADTARRLPGELSGGQRQRVCLALALAARPPLIVADEPTTALDVITQAAIVRLLRERTGGDGPALLFITHDLAVAAQVCGRVVVMDAGRVVEDGPLPDVLGAPAHPRTRELVTHARHATAALP